MKMLIFVAAVAVLEISCKGETVSEFFKEPDKACLDKEDCQPKTLPPGHLRKLGEHTETIMDEILTLDYMISGKDFYEKFARKRKPVHFKNVTYDWIATKYWKNESYLLQNYADIFFDVELGKIYTEHLHPRKTMTFEEFLRSYKNTSMYLDSPFPQSEMMNDLQLPLMMQCEWLHKAVASSHFLFSNGNTSSVLHHDGYENFLALFSGRKVVYAMEPKYIKELYMDEVEDFPGLSPINPEAVDLVKYHKFANVPVHKIELEAGDILYIPLGWHHQVRSYDSPNIAVSMWFHLIDYEGEDEYSFRDAVMQEEYFDRQVNKLPETIECRYQNVPMKLLSALKSMKDIQVANNTKETIVKEPEMPEQVESDTLVNNTVIYEKVDLDDGTLFIGSDDTWIYAVNLSTGKVMWKAQTREDTGSTCAFSNDERHLYCGADDGHLRAMLVETGQVVWAYKVGKPIISSTKVDTKNNIYFGSTDGFLYVLNPDGTLKWKKNLKYMMWSTPVLLEDENMIYIATQNDRRSNIFALNIKTGKIVWKFNVIGGITSTPRINQVTNSIYVCTHYGDIYSFDLLNGSADLISHLSNKRDGFQASPAVDEISMMMYVISNQGVIVAVDIKKKKSVWEMQTSSGGKFEASSSPLLGPGNILYVGASNGTLYAINIENEPNVIWKIDIGTAIFFSSPKLDVNRNLYIGTVDGDIVAIETETGLVKWKVKTEGPVPGTPLITNKYQYVHNLHDKVMGDCN